MNSTTAFIKAMNGYFDGGHSNFQLAAGTYWNTTINTGNRNSSFGLNGYGLTTGNDNTFSGYNALNTITTGSGNTAIGSLAGASVTATLTNSTLIGSSSSTTGNLSNATAIGYAASVTQSNSLVLGGTGANAVSVGIGTTAPAYRLDVNAYNNTAGNPLRLLGMLTGAIADSVMTASSGVVRQLDVPTLIAGGSNSTNVSTTDAATTYNFDFGNYVQSTRFIAISTGGGGASVTNCTVTASNFKDGGIYTIRFSAGSSVTSKTFVFTAGTFLNADQSNLGTQVMGTSGTWSYTFVCGNSKLYLISKQ